MGMFDHVIYSAPCGRCGATIVEWQTKDTGCTMSRVTVQDIGTGQFYADCPHCATWNEFQVRAVIVTVDRLEPLPEVLTDEQRRDLRQGLLLATPNTLWVRPLTAALNTLDKRDAQLRLWQHDVDRLREAVAALQREPPVATDV